MAWPIKFDSPKISWHIFFNNQLQKAVKERKKTVIKKDKDFTLFAWLDHWHLERLVANRQPEESLFNYTNPMLRYFYKKIKAATNISFTLRDFRHTCATNFKDAGIPSSVYFRWFGWSDDTMARKVYTHVTDYEQKVSQDWASKFDG